MWGLVVSIALVCGLVRAAVQMPSWRRLRDERRLQILTEALRTRQLNLDRAEEGAVLSRKLGNLTLERQFKEVVAYLKRKRRR